MEAKDLRIGNLCLFENYIHKIIGIKCHDKIYINKFKIEIQRISDILNSGFADIYDIKPIPLTEDWLVRFGFKKRKALGNYWFEKSINKLLFLTNDINIKKGYAYSTKVDHVFIYDLNWIKKVKYIHQLQNLYFALTGKELTLKS